jgi:hypothetical protein
MEARKAPSALGDLVTEVPSIVVFIVLPLFACLAIVLGLL